MFIGNNTNKPAFQTGRLITIYKQKITLLYSVTPNRSRCAYP